MNFHNWSKNDLRTWVNENTTDEWGVFAEDFYTFNEMYTVFAALHYDENPGWGNHISSRLGMLITPNRQNNIRLSYQNGFDRFGWTKNLCRL